MVEQFSNFDIRNQRVKINLDFFTICRRSLHRKFDEKINFGQRDENFQEGLFLHADSEY